MATVDSILIVDECDIQAMLERATTEAWGPLGWDAPIPDDYDPYARRVWEARYHIAKNWAGTGEPPAHGYGLMYSEVIARDGRGVHH